MPNQKTVAQELLRRRKARLDFSSFLEYIWWKPTPLLHGRHLTALDDLLTRATDNFLKGISTNVCVLLPFQHGKSTRTSVAFPPYFLGRCRHLQPAVLTSGYGSDLVEGFSILAKMRIDSPPYQALFPDVKVNHRTRDRADYWRIEGWDSEVHAAGILGSLTGHSASLGILDDYCKTRKDAESERYRNDVWDSFTNELCTRLGDPHVFLVVATPWHEDDIHGRISQAMARDPDFPRFDIIKFPATNLDGTYLWPEQYSDQWYKAQYAQLQGDASGLLDCDPQPRQGSVFDVEKFIYHDSSEFPDIPEARIIDLASTERQIGKNDPDFTACVRGGVLYDGDVPHVWIRHVAMGQWGTIERDKRIRALHESDPENVEYGVEGIGGYRDTLNRFISEFSGRRIVRSVPVPTDKRDRISYLEPIVDSGHFHLIRDSWNKTFVDQFRTYPRKHDDAPDATAGLYHKFKRSQHKTFSAWSVSDRGFNDLVEATA